MEINTIRSMYGPYFKQLAGNSVAVAKIDASNVYQPANEKNRVLIDKLVADNILPASHIGAKENFLDFYRQVKEGKSGLILMEHYANTDLPAIMYMLAHDGDPELAELSKNIVAIAGMKLNEDDPIVRAVAESFTRVVIYPTRSLEKNEQSALSGEEAKEEEMKARKINLAAKSEKFCQTRKIAETNSTFIKAQFKNYNENLIPRLWQYAKFSGFRTMQTTYFIQPDFGNLKVAEP